MDKDKHDPKIAEDLRKLREEAKKPTKPKGRLVHYLKSKQSSRIVPTDGYSNDGTGIRKKGGTKVRQSKKQRRANRAKLREHGFKEAK